MNSIKAVEVLWLSKLSPSWEVSLKNRTITSSYFKSMAQKSMKEYAYFNLCLSDPDLLEYIVLSKNDKYLPLLFTSIGTFGSDEHRIKPVIPYEANLFDTNHSKFILKAFNSSELSEINLCIEEKGFPIAMANVDGYNTLREYYDNISCHNYRSHLFGNKSENYVIKYHPFSLELLNDYYAHLKCYEDRWGDSSNTAIWKYLSFCDLKGGKPVVQESYVEGYLCSIMFLTVTSDCLYLYMLMTDYTLESRFKAYSVYAVSHFKSIEFAILESIKMVSAGIYFDYKKPIGFKTEWVPSLDFSSDFKRSLNDI